MDGMLSRKRQLIKLSGSKFVQLVDNGGLLVALDASGHVWFWDDTEKVWAPHSMRREEKP